jgi:hypothetical protein
MRLEFTTDHFPSYVIQFWPTGRGFMQQLEYADAVTACMLYILWHQRADIICLPVSIEV